MTKTKVKCMKKRGRQKRIKSQRDGDAGREKQGETQKETETQRYTDRWRQGGKEAKLVRENYREPGSELDRGTRQGRDKQAKY